MLLSLYTSTDVQQLLANTVRKKRKVLKFSRQVLSQRSTVPASTIKKFETTGQISLRQFLLLWQCVDSLDNIVELSKELPVTPQTIDEIIDN